VQQRHIAAEEIKSGGGCYREILIYFWCCGIVEMCSESFYLGNFVKVDLEMRVALCFVQV
jgi:hypothetical protein